MEPLDNIGAIAINMKANSLFPLGYFEQGGLDSGVMSPRSNGSSPEEKVALITRGACSYGVDTSSESYQITEEEEEESYDDIGYSDQLAPFLSSAHGHMLAFGGPGFSVALVNPCTGDTVRVPIPATDRYSCDDPFGFTTSAIDCVHPVGENQLWLGTNQGTVHVFDFCPVSSRLSNHCFLDLKESITCITSRTMKRMNGLEQHPQEEVEVVVGLPHGYLVTFNGPSNGSGGLDKLLEAKRQVIRLVPPNSPQALSFSPVSSVLFVELRERSTLWCICGDKLVILDASTWKQVKQMDIPTHDKKQEVCHQNSGFSTVLLNSEVGVWCSASFSPIVTLWNKENFSLETQIATCTIKEDSAGANVSALDFTHPHLYLGTTGGHVLVFRILTRYTKGGNGRSFELKFSAGEGLQFDTVVQLHTKPARVAKILGSSVPASPGEDSTEILILGRSHYKGDASISLLQRLKFSPYSRRQSACTSPTSSSCGTPTFPRRRSTTGSTTKSAKSMPLDLRAPLKLTLAEVSPNSSNFLPLKQ